MALSDGKGLKKIQHVRNWNPDFCYESDLFFPIMPQHRNFSNLDKWPQCAYLNSLTQPEVYAWSGQKIHFVPQGKDTVYDALNDLYEPRIFLKGQVNTRHRSWHDLFNALIWLTFPKTKAALNMRQFIAYDEHAPFPWTQSQKKRTRPQEIITMFDEGGCIFVRNAQNMCIPILFGHGFYEHIYYGNYDLSALSFYLEVDFNVDEIFCTPTQSDKFKKSTRILNPSFVSFLDNQCSQFFSCLESYQKTHLFKALHLNEMLSLISKFN